jgi:hypothetical protein
VVYKYDPKRTVDVSVIEAPSPSNAWNQLTIQNGKRALSVLVIDWTRTQ